MSRSASPRVKAAGIALWTLAVLLAGYVLLPFAFAPLAWGRVVCAGCGAREERTRYGELVLRRSATAWDGQAWWDARVPAAHVHDWRDVGCWGSMPWWGTHAVSCTMLEEGYLWLDALPRFHDQHLARAVATRLASPEPGPRWRELTEGAWASFVRGFADPRDGEVAIDRALQVDTYGRWRAAHPLWHDLFPAVLPGGDDEGGPMPR